MKTWNDLPIEILNLITTYSGRDCTKVKWMFVNKGWFEFYLAQVYSTIKTSLGNEPVLNKILNSPFDIGKYVKSINLSDIEKPTDLNELDLHNDRLSMIMKRTPNVQKVCLFRKDQALIREDWLYFSIVLINVNCWKLQFLPILGEANIVSAAYYYTCAYNSRHTLKHLELSFGMFGSQHFHYIKEFIALETLKVHKNLINGLNDLDSLLQFTPKLRELTIRFRSNRALQPIKDQFAAYSSIKKLRLYNFTPQHNNELLMLTKGFPALENLYIFSERGKAWLSEVDDPSTIETFFKYINSIAKYEIMMPGDTTEIEFSKAWLKSIEDSERDIHLLHSYGEAINQNHTNFQSAAVATFYGGLTQSIPLLKYTMMKDQTPQNISDRLRVLDNQRISSFRISGVGLGLVSSIKAVIVKERTYLKQLTFSDCTLEAYSIRTNTTLVPQHIKRIILRDCKINLLAFKTFLNEFESLDYVEFDNCKFIESGDIKWIDMSNTDIKSMKMNNFRKIVSGHPYTDTVQNVITIFLHITSQNRSRFFSIVENNLFETTRLTYDMFVKKFNINELVNLKISVKSIQKLSLRLTDTSEKLELSFD